MTHAANPERPHLLEQLAWLLLCAFVFTMPWEKGVLIPGFGSIARAAGVAAFLAGAVAVAQTRRLRAPNLVLAMSALFVCWSAATWFWSVDPAATLSRAITLMQLFALLWLLWEFCRSEARQRVLLGVYVAGAMVGAGIALVRYALHLQTYYRRYAAAGFDPNDFGLLMVLSVPMALYLGLRPKRWVSALWYGCAAVSMAAILLTASRTSLLALIVGLGFGLLTWRAASRWHRMATVALFALLVLSLVEIAPAPARGRLATIPSEVTQGSINSRKAIWKAGARVWLEHPLLGVGAGAYPEAVRPQLGRPSVAGAQYVAHNTFLSVLVETGVVGFLFWGTLLLCLAMFIWMLPGPERALFATLLAAWALGVSTLTWEHYKGTWLVFGLVMAAWPAAWMPRGLAGTRSRTGAQA
jgi:O-antigen ligase